MDEGVENKRDQPPNCEHLQFECFNNVGRLTDGDGGPVIGFVNNLKVKCVQCGMYFEFIGVEAGSSPNKPMCSADFTELRMPIRPATGRIATIIKHDFQTDKPKIVN